MVAHLPQSEGNYHFCIVDILLNRPAGYRPIGILAGAFLLSCLLNILFECQSYEHRDMFVSTGPLSYNLQMAIWSSKRQLFINIVSY